jgi:hypothetical protein
MENEFSWHSQKILKYQIAWKSTVGAELLHVEGKKDRQTHDEANCHFAKFQECA